VNRGGEKRDALPRYTGGTVADGSQTCPRFPTKIQHRTREDALEHQKRLVFLDASIGQSDKSRGLHVYPCPHCGAWHVGHDERLPLVWHYTHCAALDAILESGALKPSNPRAFVHLDLLEDWDDTDALEGSLDIAAIRLSRKFQHRHRGGLPKIVYVPVPNSTRRIRTPREWVEREQLLWFSRNEYWEHSIDDPTRELLEMHGEGLLRFGVPPSVAKLRWFDYLARNELAPWLRRYFAARADPTEWLATDEPVPLDKVRRTEVYMGAWVAIEEVDEAAFERYLAERPAVYDAALETCMEKLKRRQAERPPNAPEDHTSDATSHDYLLGYFDRVARDHKFTEAERIVYEDLFYMSVVTAKRKRE